MRHLLLHECEKHPRDCEWEERCVGERVSGILLQLVACLQSRRSPAYFMPAVDALRGKEELTLDMAAKHTWRLRRQLMFNSRCLSEM
jgi:hypothetical protein